jgi:hypothetical protein
VTSTSPAPAPTDPRPARNRTPVAVGLDVFVVVAFVALGRRSHDQDPGVSGLVETAAPFVLGLAIAWLVARAWRDPMSLRTGLVVWPVTIVAGMLLRKAFGDGTATSFVVVATLFVGLFLVGWRGVARVVLARRG